MFSAMEGGSGFVAKYAPTGGPTQKQIANAIATCARAFERLAGVVMSERIALNGKVSMFVIVDVLGLTWLIARSLH